MGSRIYLGIAPGVALLVAAIALVASVAWNSSTPAGGFVLETEVNSVSDTMYDSVCAPSPGVCTLREAMENANLMTNATVTFDIPDCSSDCVINLQSTLPAITAVGTVIDGTTEPDYDSEPVVIVDGGDTVLSGFHANADDSGIAGLTVRNFVGTGVRLDQMERSRRFVSDSVVSGAGAYSIAVTGIDTSITNTVIESGDGHGIGAAFAGTPAGLTITGSTIRNNDGAGVFGIMPGMEIRDSTITGNGEAGLELSAGTGGELTIDGNTITGNARYGIRSFATALVINNNTFASNGFAGLSLQGCCPDATPMVTNNMVLGNGTAQASVNGAGIDPELLSDGIVLSTEGAILHGNTVSGNPGNGISVFRDGRGARIGGTGAGEGNTIVGNGLAGIKVTPPEDGNDPFINDVTIRGNSISGNGTLGIDLAPTGPTENDPGDDDDGPNALQNFPELFSAISGSLTVTGSLDSRPERTFTIDFYVNDECDVSGFGEGATSLGSEDVTTPVSGEIAVNFESDEKADPGSFVTATATNLETGDTSEFSQCIEVQGPATPTPTPGPTATPTPTASPSPTSTAIPTQTPTPGPTQTPSGKPVFGDMDCDGDVDAVDALAILRFVAGLPPLAQTEPCDDVGSAGAAFGDLDCDGDVDAVDALAVLGFVAGLSPLAQTEPCPDVGT